MFVVRLWRPQRAFLHPSLRRAGHNVGVYCEKLRQLRQCYNATVLQCFRGWTLPPGQSFRFPYCIDSSAVYLRGRPLALYFLDIIRISAALDRYYSGIFYVDDVHECNAGEVWPRGSGTDGPKYLSINYPMRHATDQPGFAYVFQQFHVCNLGVCCSTALLVYCS